MKYKIFTLLAVSAFVLNAFAGTITSTSGKSNELAKLLPASDGVITLDASRMFNEALPQLLSANQPMLNKMNAKLDEIEAETALDLRKFKEVAVGIKGKATSGDEIDLEPVVLARGDLKASSVIAVMRLATDGKYRTEEAGDRTIYIFSTEEIIDNNKPKKDEKKDPSIFDKAVDRMFKGLEKEMAMTTYDEDTLVVGTVDRVKEMIGDTPRVSDEVLGLLNRKPSSIANMGMMLPTGVSKFIALENDELGNALDSIRQLQGALDVAENTASLSLMAKTLETKNAEDLEALLNGLQMFGKVALGNSKGADKQVYARMVENAKIGREENAVMIDLTVPQKDIDILIGKK